MKAQIRGCQILGFKRDKYKCNRRLYSFVTGVDGTTEQNEGSVSPKEEGTLAGDKRRNTRHLISKTVIHVPRRSAKFTMESILLFEIHFIN